VNIHNYYRKFLEKSRAFLYVVKEKSKFFLSAAKLHGKLINISLLALFFVLIILIIISRITGVGPGIPRHIDLSISPQFENLFGKELTSALIKDFEKQRPDLRIKKAEEGADIIFFDDNDFGRLRSGSELLSLDPYIDTKPKDDEIAIEQDSGQDEPVKKTQWALPLVSFMDILFYNIDILQAANFDRPPKTRAEFLNVAKTIAHASEEQNAVYCFALALDDPQGYRRNIYPWIWAAGGAITGGAINGGINDGAPTLSRASIDTIAFFGQLNREGLLPPEHETYARLLEKFAQGKIAMITGSTGDIAYLQRGENKINFGITAIPGTAQGKPRMGLFRIYAGISANSAMPDQAWAFISFLTGKSQILSEALAAVPGSLPAAFPGEYIVKNPLYSKAWDIFEAAEIVDSGDDASEEEIERLIIEKIRELGM